MGSILSTKNPKPKQSMHWTNITTIVGESTYWHCQQDQVSHRPLRQLSDAGLLLVWPLLLLLSPRHRHGLFAGDGRLPNQLAAVTSTVSVDLDCETWSCSTSVPAAVYRPSRSTWIAKREAVRLPSWLQFLGPWAWFEEDINPPTDSLNEKFLVVKQQLITCLTDRNDSPLRWRNLRDWVYMNSNDCILCRSCSSCCVSRCEDRRRSTSLRACVCSRLSRARLSACRRRACSLLRSSLSSAVKAGRLVLRDSMGASKLDLLRIRFSTIRKVNTPREGKL